MKIHIINMLKLFFKFIKTNSQNTKVNQTKKIEIRIIK